MEMGLTGCVVFMWSGHSADRCTNTGPSQSLSQIFPDQYRCGSQHLSGGSWDDGATCRRDHAENRPCQAIHNGSTPEENRYPTSECHRHPKRLCGVGAMAK